MARMTRDERTELEDIPRVLGDRAADLRRTADIWGDDYGISFETNAMAAYRESMVTALRRASEAVDDYCRQVKKVLDADR